MRGTLRTLDVLRVLGRRKRATVLELFRETGISRGALYRILETLRESGYVTIDLSNTHYCLTDVVLELSAGFTEEDKLLNAARPTLRKLQHQISWPVELATFSHNAMCLRETTVASCPISTSQNLVAARFPQHLIGLRTPMLSTAAGRTYLAWCTDDEREAILQSLAAAGETAPPPIHDPKRLRRLLDEIRARGYGLRCGEEPFESGAIAVPVLANERVLGCVIISFLRRSLSVDRVLARCVEPMRSAAMDIGRAAVPVEHCSRTAHHFSSRTE